MNHSSTAPAEFVRLEELTAALQALRARLEQAWCADTSTDPVGWRKRIPAKGQCAVTVLLVQELFGGEIVRALVCGQSHFWNRLTDGVEVDLTRDQFGVWLLTGPVEVRSRAYLLATIRADGRSTAERYQILREYLAR